MAVSSGIFESLLFSRFRSRDGGWPEVEKMDGKWKMDEDGGFSERTK